jgi:two-component system nitrate/nitrite response regulator NarL
MPEVAPAKSRSRVLIIEDHTLFAESLEVALSLEGYDVRRLPLPEEGGSLATLRSSALRINPRIVLLDLDLGRFGDGAALIAPLSRAGANVVVVTSSVDRARWGGCVRSGARKVLSKSGPLQDTLACVRRLHQGLPVMSADELEGLLRALGADAMENQDKRRRLGQRRLGGHGAHPGEVHPGQAAGFIPARRGRHGPPRRVAARDRPNKRESAAYAACGAGPGFLGSLQGPDHRVHGEEHHS